MSLTDPSGFTEEKVKNAPKDYFSTISDGTSSIVISPSHSENNLGGLSFSAGNWNFSLNGSSGSLVSPPMNGRYPDAPSSNGNRGNFSQSAISSSQMMEFTQGSNGGFSEQKRPVNIERNIAQKGQSLEDYMQEKFGKLAITDAERGFAEAGDRKAFWTSRMERGDPIASVALGIVRNNSFVGFKYVGGRLANMFTGLEGDALNALGVDIMRAHVGAVDFDFSNKIGIPGLLSPTQAAAYHHDVFSNHGLSSGQFGGTLFNTSPNLMRSIWCTGCDHSGAAIR